MNVHIERLKRKIPDSFLTIRYEDLLENPERTIQQVCDFLNLKYYPEQLKFNEYIKIHHAKMLSAKDNAKLKIFDSHLKNLIYPISNKFSNSWEKTLSKKEIEEVSFITRKIANNYGYNLSNNGKLKLKLIINAIKVKIIYFKLRLYYFLSLSIKLN